MWAILIETPKGTAKIIAKDFQGADPAIVIKKIIWDSCVNIDKETHYGASCLYVPYHRVYSITLLPEKTEATK